MSKTLLVKLLLLNPKIAGLIQKLIIQVHGFKEYSRQIIQRKLCNIWRIKTAYTGTTGGGSAGGITDR